MDFDSFYRQLFEDIVTKFGALDDDTITSLIGLAAGGPVSLCTRESSNLYVTCELAVSPDQRESAEGLKFELLALEAGDEDWCRKVFTALGSLSTEVELGDGHTVDISDVLDGEEAGGVVQLKLFSRALIDGDRYGVYQVLPVSRC